MAVAPWGVPGRRSLLLLMPFGKSTEGEETEDDDDDRVQVVVGVALEVRDRLKLQELAVPVCHPQRQA